MRADGWNWKTWSAWWSTRVPSTAYRLPWPARATCCSSRTRWALLAQGGKCRARMRPEQRGKASPAPNIGLELTASSVRCAPAFSRVRPLTGHNDNPFNGLHMNNGVRSTWPALLSGTGEGGKPRDKRLATLSHNRAHQPDLIPRLTTGTCDDGPGKRTGASG